MPGYKSHTAFGALLYAFILIIICQWKQPTLITAAEWLIFMLAGSLFPDIDVKSRGQHLLYGILFVLFTFLLVQGCYKIVAIFGILSLIPMLVKHRGIFHNITFLICLPTFTALATISCMPAYSSVIMMDAFFFIIGALGHVWLDVGLRRMMR